MKEILQILTVLFIVTACSQPEGVHITGSLSKPIAGESLLVSVFEDTGLKPIDTVQPEANGEFDFYLNPMEPTFYRFNFFNRQQLNVILEGNEDEVSLELEGDNPQGIFTVEGSKHTQYLQDIQGLMNDHQTDVQDLNQQAIQARMEGDQAAIDEITASYYALMRQNQKDLKSFVWKITPSLAAYYGLQAMNIEEQFTFYDSVAQRFEASLPDHPFTQDLVSRVNGLRSLAVGQPAPEISLPNPDGEIIKLSDLKGQYVILDFWAAWCRPCRQENPNMVRLYELFKEENFEVLGVSLDRTKEAWVKAIQEDGLPWLQVSDLQYFNSVAARTYKITAIPATYLIDPDGNIVAKGLRGRQLEEKLKEIFKKQDPA